VHIGIYSVSSKGGLTREIMESCGGFEISGDYRVLKLSNIKRVQADNGSFTFRTRHI